MRTRSTKPTSQGPRAEAILALRKVLNREPTNDEVTDAVEKVETQALAEHAAEIHKLLKHVAGNVIEVGRRLTVSKDIAGHGNWLQWLEREFRWKEQTARNFMLVYEMALKNPNFGDLNIPVSGLYMLAAPSTPPEARETIIEQAKAGEKVSLDQVKTTIASAKSSKRKEYRPPCESTVKAARAVAAVEAAAIRSVGASKAGPPTEPPKGKHRRTPEEFQAEIKAKRQAAQAESESPTATVPAPKESTTTSDNYNVLVAAWHKCSSDERHRFAKYIGATFDQRTGADPFEVPQFLKRKSTADADDEPPPTAKDETKH